MLIGVFGFTNSSLGTVTKRRERAGGQEQECSKKVIEHVRERHGHLGTEKPIYVRPGRPARHSFLQIPAESAGRPERKIYLRSPRDRSRLNRLIREVCDTDLDSTEGRRAVARLEAEAVLSESNGRGASPGAPNAHPGTRG